MLTRPTTRYAKSGDASIAYQVYGEGDCDLVLIAGPASHVDLEWENPLAERAARRLASFARVIRFDRRGTGVSDPVVDPPTLEQQMDDLRAVMGEAGVERAALWGGSDVGLAAMFAATYPDQVSELILYGVPVRGEDFVTPELADFVPEALEHYGEGRFIELYAPSQVGNEEFEDWWERFERGCLSPGMARKILELQLQTDISAILDAIRVPTLVLHRTGDKAVPIESGRELAKRIPNARLVELPGTDNYPWTGDWKRECEPILDEIEEFLTGQRRAPEPARVLSTILFTDIVGSTEHAARVGDERWRDVLQRHDELIRAELGRWRGKEVKTVGDGFLATFDGPARAVRCAEAIVRGVEAEGLRVRAGLHTGECELLDDDVGGIAVHIGARVTDLADAGEVLVSSTVKELVVGSGLSFDERGTHELRGVPGEWRLFALENGASGNGSSG
ncbi:MAG TPA: adenylate/guanylate cyclase domain-containing protein [Thermoleophilaceae bacterium]|nr:adenylate/guanylate cyclase domain-containing protein [Thermoleophilaceae bacterium]